MRVSNGGAGIEYHPRTVHAESGGMLVNVPLHLRDVPRRRATDPTWWLLVTRALIFPDPSNGPSELYERLLPHLNGRPVLADVADDAEVSCHSPLPFDSRARVCRHTPSLIPSTPPVLTHVPTDHSTLMWPFDPIMAVGEHADAA